MFKPAALILASTIQIDNYQEQKYYFNNDDYVEVAREFMLQHKTIETFDASDFLYKLIIQELENQE